ncbi:MAG: DNA translocase FtsK, partial [Patescibacteria group bacterium]
MARRTENRKGRPKEDLRSGKRWHDGLAPETKRSMLAILFFALTIVTLLAYWDLAGSSGRFISAGLRTAIGQAYFLAPLTSALIGFSLLFAIRRRILAASLVGGTIFLVASLALVDLFFGENTAGWVGLAANWPLEKVFDFWAALVIEASLLIIAILMMANIPLWKPREEEAKPETEEKILGASAEALQALIPSAKKDETPAKPASSVMVESPEEAPTQAEREATHVPRRGRRRAYVFPPLSLLNDDRGTPSSGDIRANANIIKRTLLNFGIDVEMGEVSVGPTVTQYTLKPAEGVKISRILALSNDLALALAAHPIRIEAPIPGKSLVGIEVPNRSIALVGLRNLLQNEIFQSSSAPLLFVLGRDVAGSPVYANLAKMPHLLVAGATGSGKSVMLHAMITAFLYRNPPEFLRFLIIDPKRVELAVYSGIPHLLTPPITEAKKTIQALRWAVKEMERRYEELARAGVRDIAGYNERFAKKNAETLPGETMPYLVIIIDELADLMASYPREVEGSIIRLAQMARAVGIHLVVSTQRPSVEVITGLIKANITSRVAFQVASQVDARTILDVAGAEKLLGNGDMLFLAGDTARPRRIQGGFVSESEVERITQFIRDQAEDLPAETEEDIFVAAPPGLAEAISDDENFGDDDPLYEEAKSTIIQA